MSRWEVDDDFDIRVRRGRVSPNPYYPDPRLPIAPPLARPIYYTHGDSYLVPEHNVGVRRSRSHSHSSPPAPPPAPGPAPVIINNRIYNEYDDEDDRYLQLSPGLRARSRSRSRRRSRADSHSSYGSRGSRDSRESRTRENYELERTRKELDAFRMEAKREEEEKRYRKEMELERLRADRKAEDEKKRLKKQTDEAIDKYKREEAEKAAKEKKEKEEQEKEYKRRLEDDLRKSGLDEKQVAAVLNKEKAVAAQRPTYTRMSRRHLSIETLNRYKIDYEFDADPDYVLIKRWVPEYEQDFLWNHTKEIRERRERIIERPVLVAIEGKKKHHEEPEFEFVRKKKHERKPSPSPLLTFLAGGKR